MTHPTEVPSHSFGFKNINFFLEEMMEKLNNDFEQFIKNCDHHVNTGVLVYWTGRPIQTSKPDFSHNVALDLNKVKELKVWCRGENGAELTWGFFCDMDFVAEKVIREIARHLFSNWTDADGFWFDAWL